MNEPEVYVFEAGTLGTPSNEQTVASGGSAGEGQTFYTATANGEIEWITRRGDTETGRWIVASGERQRPIAVPGGQILTCRRPGATVALGTVRVTVTEGGDGPS